MPNWTEVRVVFFDKKDADRFIRYDAGDNERVFSFEDIAPTPKTAEECKEKYPEYYNENGFEGIQRLDDRPWFNWYNWHCGYWGTKWDAVCPAYRIDEDGSVELVFNSAWNYPTYVMDAMVKMTEGKVEITFADEDYDGTWHMTYEGGKFVQEWDDDEFKMKDEEEEE